MLVVTTNPLEGKPGFLDGEDEFGFLVIKR